MVQELDLNSVNICGIGFAQNGPIGVPCSMRFLAVLITVLFLIVGGKLCLTGDKMYDESQVFPAAEHIDYQEFAQDRPLVGWYQVNGCIVDLTEAAYRSARSNNSPESVPTVEDIATLNRTKDIYVPTHDPGALEMPADIILLTHDPDLVKAVRAVSAGHVTSQHLTAPRIIKGMIRTPSELPDRVRRLLGNSINTQSIIIEEYASPSVARSVQTMAAGGAMILSTALLWLLIWKSDRKPIQIPDEFLTDDLAFDEDEY